MYPYSEQVVQGSAGPFLVSGLLSPPLSECCSASANKECQLTYLNGRWLRNCTLLSAPLNELYAGIFAALTEEEGAGAGVGQQQRRRGTGGMTSRHATAQLLGDCRGEEAVSERRAPAALLPRFVLQISCSSSACDLLEGGTVALVREDRLLREAVAGVVRRLLQECFPHLQQRELSHLLGQPVEVGEQTETAQLGAATALQQLRAEEELSESPAVVHSAAQSFVMQSPLFQSAFFSGRTTPVSSAPLVAGGVEQLTSPCSALRGMGAAVQTPTPQSSPQRQRLCSKRAREEAMLGMVVATVDGVGDGEGDTGELWYSGWGTRRQRLDFTAEEDVSVGAESPAGCTEPLAPPAVPPPLPVPPTHPPAPLPFQHYSYDQPGLLGCIELAEGECVGASSASSCTSVSSSQLVAADILCAADTSTAEAAVVAHSAVSDQSASLYEQYAHLTTETNTHRSSSSSSTSHLRYTRHSRRQQQQPSAGKATEVMCDVEKASSKRKSTSFPPVSAVQQRSLTLSKSALSQHLRCIAQVDRRYLLAGTCVCADKTSEAQLSAELQSSTPCGRCGDCSLLLLFDQHAVDERLRYEALTTAVCDRGEHLHPTAVSAELALRSELLDVLTQRTGLLQRWKFAFVFSMDRAGLDRSPYFGGSCSSTTVTLTQVPVVLGEPLQPQDFVEFIEQLAATAVSVPDAALVPPAVQRIVCSKACRGAVKFGDALPQEQCAQLLTALARDTELPFQCAHGRPSVAPLVHIQQLRENKVRGIALKQAARCQYHWSSSG